MGFYPNILLKLYGIEFQFLFSYVLNYLICSYKFLAFIIFYEIKCDIFAIRLERLAVISAIGSNQALVTSWGESHD